MDTCVSPCIMFLSVQSGLFSSGYATEIVCRRTLHFMFARFLVFLCLLPTTLGLILGKNISFENLSPPSSQGRGQLTFCCSLLCSVGKEHETERRQIFVFGFAMADTTSAERCQMQLCQN